MKMFQHAGSTARPLAHVRALARCTSWQKYASRRYESSRPDVKPKEEQEAKEDGVRTAFLAKIKDSSTSSRGSCHRAAFSRRPGPLGRSSWSLGWRSGGWRSCHAWRPQPRRCASPAWGQWPSAPWSHSMSWGAGASCWPSRELLGWRSRPLGCLYSAE